MRTAEERVTAALGGNMNIATLKLAFLYEIIREAQIEAIKECAETAAIIYWDGFNKSASSINYFSSGADNLQPDRQSILKLIDQVK